MKKLIRDVKEQKFNYIIVIKLDRFSRRQKDVLYLLEDVLEPNEIGFKSVTEPFDTTTPFGKAAIGMMAVFAQLERETIVERVKMAKKEAAKQGRWGGGSPPYGFTYDFEKKLLKADPDTAPIVELIYSLYESGKYGHTALAKELNDRGISSATGGKWAKDSVRKILSNPHYAGYIHRCGELTEGNHQGFIGRERWHKVQEMLQGRYIPHPAKDDDNLLTGMIYCGRCGARMRFKTQNWKDPKSKVIPAKVWTRKYYICYSRMAAGPDSMVKDKNCKLPFVRVEVANQVVVDHLTKLSLSPKLLKEAADEALKRKHSNISEKDLNATKKEILAIRKKIDRWNTAFENGAIEVEDLMQRTKDLREKRQELEKRSAELEKALLEEKESMITSQELIEQVKNFPAIWEYATPDERRLIVSSMIDRVLVHDVDNIEVVLNI